MSVAGLQRVSKGEAPTKPITIAQALEQMRPKIEAALPRHLNADRMIRIALTEFNKTPDLQKCDVKTVFASIIIASQLGLEPGVMGQGFLIPYKDQKKNVTVCTFVPGWQGYVDLISRAGRATVHTGTVYPGDEFDFEYGSSPNIKHKPGDESDDDEPFTHVYAVGWVKDAQRPVIEVWSRAKVLKHLKRFNKVGDRHYAIKGGEHNLGMYGRKVALLQVIKYMPKSVELHTAAQLDYAADAGTQNLTIEGAAQGTFDAPEQDDEQLPRIQKLFDKLDLPGDIRDEELAKHADKLDDLEAKLKAELAKGSGDAA
jgi:recombination protein RecT